MVGTHGAPKLRGRAGAGRGPAKYRREQKNIFILLITLFWPGDTLYGGRL